MRHCRRCTGGASASWTAKVAEFTQLCVRSLQLFLVVCRPDPEAASPLFPPAHPRLAVEPGLPRDPGTKLGWVDVTREPGGERPRGFRLMRPAELYALRREFCHPNWPTSDPDLERRKEALERDGPTALPALRVQWQFQREFGRGPVKLFPPKYESHRNLSLPGFIAELHTALLATHDHEYLFPAISGGLLADTNFSYSYWRPVARGRPASEEFARIRPGQPPLAVSRRPPSRGPCDRVRREAAVPASPRRQGVARRRSTQSHRRGDPHGPRGRRRPAPPLRVNRKPLGNVPGRLPRRCA